MNSMMTVKEESITSGRVKHDWEYYFPGLDIFDWAKASILLFVIFYYIITQLK
jgi:hypothetical protein